MTSSHSKLDQLLERTVVIAAPRDTVFRFFTDSARWAAWWGSGSTIDAKPGGDVTIRYPDGTLAVGKVVEVARPEQIVFTYGYASGQPIGPGESRVTITLETARGGTLLRLRHAFAEAKARDQHAQGWRYQLSLFSNAVADQVHARAVDTIDAWYALWAETDAAKRHDTIARLCAPSVMLRDRHSYIEGAAELDAQIVGAQQFSAGVRMDRRGEVQHCQGVVLGRWAVLDRDGKQRGTGSNVFELDVEGRITSVAWGSGTARRAESSCILTREEAGRTASERRPTPSEGCPTASGGCPTASERCPTASGRCPPASGGGQTASGGGQTASGGGQTASEACPTPSEDGQTASEDVPPPSEAGPTPSEAGPPPFGPPPATSKSARSR